MEKKNKRAGKRKRWLIAAAAAIVVVGLAQVTRHFYPESEKDLRSQLRDAVKKGFPRQAAQVHAAYGLRRFGSTRTPTPAMGRANSEVVLIHGLDDPGKVWMNLAPALVDLEFQVWLMAYPNDQPIRESARFFLEELRPLAINGVESVSLVAHSMGGLVSREMLTNPDWDYPARVVAGVAPAVGQLIMVATPNHGSELVRARALMEIRDQIGHLFSGNYHWLRWVLDGAGEAGIDLLPGSRFLEALNSRPHPAGVEMMVITGVMSPFQAEQINAFVRKIASGLPANARSSLFRLEGWLESMANGIGDGLVTVDSSRLDGFPQKIVQGTHMSVIRNIRSASTRVPPAVPIVVEQLQRMGEINRVNFTPSLNSQLR